jgi:DNA replication licensing factor MCM5
MIPGIVTAASKPKHAAHSVTVMCRGCRLETTISAAPGQGGLNLPRVCTLSGGADGGGGGCGLDPWVVLPQKSHFADQQTLKLQVRSFIPCEYLKDRLWGSTAFSVARTTQ